MKRSNDGFTLIELIVTLTLGTALIIAFFMIYRAGLTATTAATRQETAKNIAYADLRKYSQASSVTWPHPFLCTSGVTDGVATGGQDVVDQRTLTAADGLPSPATVTVKSLAPYGCNAANADMPLMIEVTVQYGTPSQKVVYTTYAKK